MLPVDKHITEYHL